MYVLEGEMELDWIGLEGCTAGIDNDGTGLAEYILIEGYGDYYGMKMG